MKKYFLCLIVLFGLFGCEETKEDLHLNTGFIHFASIVVLDDLITNGISSEFVSLSPIPIVNPDDTLAADDFLNDFKNDFTTAKEKYPVKLTEGLALTWNVNYNADTQNGLSYYKENHTKNSVFIEKIALNFDDDYYSATSYPVYSKNSNVTIICQSFTNAIERKDNRLTWLEVTLSNCTDASDYYNSLRERLKNQQIPLKERLTNIYSGQEAVNEELALKLLAFYKAGSSFAADSVCLKGDREECLSSLKSEIIRKFEPGSEQQTPGNIPMRMKEKNNIESNNTEINKTERSFTETIQKKINQTETKKDLSSNSIEQAAQSLHVSKNE